MAPVKSIGQQAVSAIKDWAFAKQSALSVTETTDRYESVLRIVPKNEKSCPIEFRIGKNNTMGSYFGKGMAFEEIELFAYDIRDICESVFQGRVEEKIWMWCGKVIRTSGRIRLTDGELSDDGSRHWASFFVSGKPYTIQYEPYDRSPNVNEVSKSNI